jgi:four helix bundle protein
VPHLRVRMASDAAQDIRDRAFKYACAIGKLTPTLMSQPGFRPIADQLIKSGTGVGANLEEAKAASSKREFIRFVEIALREARESVYWLRICVALHLGPANEIEVLRWEGVQISRILATIILRAKG